MDGTDLFMTEREMLRRGLNVLDQMVRKMEDGGRIEIADAALLVGFLERLGREYDRIPESRVLLAGIEEALRNRRGSVFVRDLRRLGLTLKNHLDGAGIVPRSEMYPEIQASLSRLERKFARAASPVSYV